MKTQHRTEQQWPVDPNPGPVGRTEMQESRPPTAATTEGGDTTMQLSALHDLNQQAAVRGAGIPCQENDAELWFAESPADVEFAKSLCRACPAVRACLAGAIDRAEPWGVWGGELLVQGAIVARKRPRGRPRKNAVAA